MKSPDESDDGFTDEERITQNLRLGSDSIPAANRTALGLFAFIPAPWRGPVVCFAMAIIGYLIGANSHVVQWIKSAINGSP